MVRKITYLGITIIMLISLASQVACVSNVDEEILIPFERSGKGVNYSYPDGHDSLLKRDNLLEMITSMAELAQLMNEKEFIISPMYEEAFFDEHTLILYFFLAGICNNLEIVLMADGDAITVYHLFDIPPNGAVLPVIRPWTLLLEVNNADITGLTHVQATL